MNRHEKYNQSKRGAARSKDWKVRNAKAVSKYNQHYYIEKQMKKLQGILSEQQADWKRARSLKAKHHIRYEIVKTSLRMQILKINVKQIEK